MSSTARLADGTGSPPQPANNYDESPNSPASGVGLLRTSFGTAHAVEMAHEGVPMVVVQRQLGHANLGMTWVYLQGTDAAEIISTVHARPAPMISATAGLRSGQ